MPQRRESRGDEATPPVLEGPEYVEDAIVFAVRDAEAAHEAFEAFAADTSDGGAVAKVLKYADRCTGATLTPLFGERARQSLPDRNWALAASPGGSVRCKLHLRLADPSDGERLLDELATDPRVAYAHHPVIQYPLDAPPGGLKELATRARFHIRTMLGRLMGFAPQEDEQWWLGRCGFPSIWDTLDQGHVPGAIAVIDQGGDTGHPELAGRIVTKEVPGRDSEPSTSIHASAVAGVISAHRDPRVGISGACSARIHLYNVWTSERGFDGKGYYNALKSLADNARRGGTEDTVRVVNLSLGSSIDDPEIRQQVHECIKSGLILVAAAGNNGDRRSRPVYPAAYPGVISVAATSINPSDAKAEWSAPGMISAPGEFIRTVFGSDRTSDHWRGTSFAAPIVSAAVWLALRKESSLTRADLLELLQTSVSTATRSGSRGLGFGRLDMLALQGALNPRAPRAPRPR